MSPNQPPKMAVRLSVNDAAKVLDVAPTTIYGMIQREELHARKDESGRLWLDAAEVAAAPHGRGRGHPVVNPPDLKNRVQVDPAPPGSRKKGTRSGVQTARATDEQLERWRAAASRQGLAVGPWLAKLANENS